jgi:glycine/D-amino acid oxidase-like deaminating enzyme
VAINQPKALNYYICTMQIDYLIIGQGLCGTWLSYYLQKAEQSFLVIDQPHPYSASKVAAGIVNPVTGRRIVKTWMIDELLPFVWEQYRQLGNELNTGIITQKNIIDFFPTPQMKLAFDERFENDTQYLLKPTDQLQWNHFFNYDFGAGEIEPCYLVDTQTLLPAFRQHLNAHNQLREELFNLDDMTINDGHIQYKDITAQKIIFCDGVTSNNNPYFNKLPFAPNKGEMLLVNIPGLPNNNIYKKGMNLVPWKDKLFWMGSSYEWTFDNDQPTETFRKKSEAILKEWLKIPFTIVDHMAAVRPATLERRPFVGLHPLHPQIGILNGMGTKGCSLAPYFAKQLVNHLVSGIPLPGDADVQRFKRVLSR